VPAVAAILDRFRNHAITLAINGRSYRVKASLPTTPEKQPNRKSNALSTAGGAS